LEQKSNIKNDELNSLQNYILIKKNYVMALYRRIAFSRIGIALKDEIQKNEIEIQLYETISKISFTERQIKQAELDFDNKLFNFCCDQDELIENYDKLLQLAKQHQQDSIEIKHLLYSANWKLINENTLEQILFYKTLQTAVNHFINTRT